MVILGTLSKSVGNVIDLGGKLIDNWDKIKDVGSLLSSGLSKTVGFIFSPTGAIIAGIAAAIAIGVALYKNWDTITEKAGQLAANVRNKFEDIRKNITDKIERAKDAVGNAIEKNEKLFFNFKWELPKLKLPRISVQGKFSLAPPSVPKFGIEWRKEGAIFTKPYVFGNQGWGGEAGPEAVLPIEKLAGILADTMEQLGYSNNQTTGNEFDINALAKLINNSNKETKLYLTVKVGEDTLTDKVVSNINRQSRINGETVVIV